MRNHEEGGKTLPLFDVMLLGSVACWQMRWVKQKQLTAKDCRVLLWMKSAATSDLLYGRIHLMRRKAKFLGR